ncbi:Solute:Sodium Symporter (SSS) Family [Achlya hypogyna]|uniref:Solute:Sodium Symporter (SSS) Family n=1 Tax=Achlya hypogyna TaxID=1202772 RepID=A0A1V9Z904_ACHHY|nr:Solute:Sodium Symporter (SSS) Family [Achlya hypogyna]
MVDAWVAYVCLVATLLAVAAYAVYVTYLTPVQSVTTYISAKKTQTPLVLGWCMFSSSMGSWALFSFPDTAAQVGTWGLVGYWLSVVLGYAVLALAGPAISDMLGDGITLSDYAARRFGIPQQLYVALISIFYQLISISAELTAIGSLMSLLAPDTHTLVSVVLVSVVTCFYTLFGGIKASIATDAVKGGFILILIIVVCIAMFTSVHIPSGSWAETGVANLTVVGFEAVITLVVAVVSSNLFLTGFWLRTFSAKTPRDLHKSCAFAAIAATPFIVLLGITGMIGKILHPDATDSYFFQILLNMNEAWSIVVLIVIAALVSSTADTIQTGMSAEILTNFQSLTLTQARIISVFINIPAIAIAMTNTSVLQLFLIADLLCAATVGPIFLGLWDRCHSKAVIIGCVSGLLTIFVCGWARQGDFVDGFREFVLAEGPFTEHSMILFLCALFVPVLVTVGISLLLKPEPRKAPLLQSPKGSFAEAKSPQLV